MKEPARTLAWDDFRLIKAIAERRALPAAAAALGWIAVLVSPPRDGIRSRSPVAPSTVDAFRCERDTRYPLQLSWFCRTVFVCVALLHQIALAVFPPPYLAAYHASTRLARLDLMTSSELTQ